MALRNLDKLLQEQIQVTEQWLAQGRFANVKRPYTAEQLVGMSQSPGIPVTPTYADVQARKLYSLLGQAYQSGTPIVTMGMLDPVQMTQFAKFLPALYISGWACSSTLTSTNEVGPDLADYPYDTVPRAVERITKAQQLHDRKAWNAFCKHRDASRFTDYLKPIVADGDHGFAEESRIR